MGKRDETEMWGIRFSDCLLMAKSKNSIEFMRKMDELADDLRKRGACVMKGELMGYFYLMFFSKQDRDDFFEEKKEKRIYQEARIRKMAEPAYVPNEYLNTKKD